MNITQEMISALRYLRNVDDLSRPGSIKAALDVLDNAEVFKAIDEHTGYDIEPEEFLPLGDPSEYGDTVAKTDLITEYGDLVVRCTQHGELFRGFDSFENRANAHEVKALHNGLHVDRAGRKGRMHGLEIVDRVIG